MERAQKQRYTQHTYSLLLLLYEQRATQPENVVCNIMYVHTAL